MWTTGEHQDRLQGRMNMLVASVSDESLGAALSVSGEIQQERHGFRNEQLHGLSEQLASLREWVTTNIHPPRGESRGAMLVVGIVIGLVVGYFVW